ncbi:MAG: crossover junction endodeoxyribonuclease RuvC [Desulfohalobiaceae bacterium]
MYNEGKVVLGLDPGSRSTGFGLVQEASGELRLLQTGCIRARSGDALSQRLGRIFQGITRIILEFGPQEAAVEDVFVARNTASALKLGQARGAAIAACACLQLQVFTYEPNLIKKTLVGAGKAEKSQVAFMAGRLLNADPRGWSLDSSDALAAAICHLNMQRRLSWEQRTGVRE